MTGRIGLSMQTGCWSRVTPQASLGLLDRRHGLSLLASGARETGMWMPTRVGLASAWFRPGARDLALRSPMAAGLCCPPPPQPTSTAACASASPSRYAITHSSSRALRGCACRIVRPKTSCLPRPSPLPPAKLLLDSNGERHRSRRCRATDAAAGPSGASKTGTRGPLRRIVVAPTPRLRAGSGGLRAR